LGIHSAGLEYSSGRAVLEAPVSITSSPFLFLLVPLVCLGMSPSLFMILDSFTVVEFIFLM
jgi:hypothetical protein